MNERTQIGLKLILIHIVIPIGLTIVSIFVVNDAYFFFAITQSVFCILFLAGYWEFFGIKFKKLFGGILEIILMVVFIEKLLLSNKASPNLYFVTILSLIQVYLIIELIKIVVVIYIKDKAAVEIHFPLKNGMYLITDGGNAKISRLMNYHYYSSVHKKKKTNNSMLYAVDIVKLNVDEQKFLPKRNEEYPIFGEKVYCPIAGQVVKVENDIDDNKPFIGEYPYNTGNTIVIRNGNQYCLLGHLKKGSIRIKEGEIIKSNDLIAEIGNSGFSERPHLHWQLIESDSDNYWFGRGISIQYNGKNLYKNRIIKIL
jgi:hypothetical protein